MNPSRPFIQRPVATSLLMMTLLIFGLFAYRLLPVSSLPEVDYPTIQVATFYPGASPSVMASVITAPLERQFGQMPGLNQMTSTSSAGASMIVLQFALTMGLDVAEQQVQAAINAAANYLPADLPIPPVYSKVNPADAPILTLALTSHSLPLPRVEDLADTRLAQKISQVSGVGLVSMSGGQRPAVRVQVNSAALAKYNLNLEDVRIAINNANVNAAKGSFDGSLLSYTVNSNDQLFTSAEYKPLILAYNNGAPIRLSDVANVIDDIENNKLAAWMNTTPAVIMNIQRQPGSNVIRVADRVKQLLTKLRATLPAQLNIDVLTDRTQTIRASVRDVEYELLLSVALVVTVIFLFLRNFLATFIPSVVVPLSLIGTFGVMYFLGFSLNNLTLMAITIAAGFVVDDAIVMIENIARHIESGETPMEAALKGAKQIGFTIMSLTLSLIAVLIPLLFMSDLIGRLFREFALTLAATILISAFVSLTLTPMMCARILTHHQPGTSRFNRTMEYWQNYISQKYRVTLLWVLDHEKFMLITMTVTLLITAMLFFFIPKGLFPVQDTGVIQGISEAAQTVSFAAMSERQQALAKIILQDPAVANLSSFIGVDGVNATLNSGRMLITLKPLSQRSASASEVIERLQDGLAAKVPGITLYLQPVQDITIDDRVTRAQYQYSVGSPLASDVAKWTAVLVNKLRALPELQNVASDQQEEGLKTHITFDRDTAYRLGITPQMIDDTLYDAFGQRQVSTIFTQNNQYRVILEALPQYQLNPAQLNNIYIKSASGTSVPLAVFTQVTQTTGPLVIHRQNQFPVATISFNLAGSNALDKALRAVHDVEKTTPMPASIQTGFEGAAKIFQSSLHNEGWLLLAAILVVYIVLGVLYESFIHPVTILSTLPSACMGALLILLMTEKVLGVTALIGIVLLIGIVMKNAIMMIDFALEQERVHLREPRAAIYEAALLRFRPILMTTLAAIFGAIPLAIGAGMGAELRQPLGLVIIGGLVVSQLLTLYTTPVVYVMFDRIFSLQNRRVN